MFYSYVKRLISPLLPKKILGLKYVYAIGKSNSPFVRGSWGPEINLPKIGYWQNQDQKPRFLSPNTMHPTWPGNSILFLS